MERAKRVSTITFLCVVLLSFGYATTGGSPTRTPAEPQTRAAQMFALSMKYASLYSSLTEDGKKKKEELDAKMTPEEREQFDSFFRSASENQVKELARKLNVTPMENLKGTWWLR